MKVREATLKRLAGRHARQGGRRRRAFRGRQDGAAGHHQGRGPGHVDAGDEGGVGGGLRPAGRRHQGGDEERRRQGGDEGRRRGVIVPMLLPASYRDTHTHCCVIKRALIMMGAFRLSRTYSLGGI